MRSDQHPELLGLLKFQSGDSSGDHPRQKSIAGRMIAANSPIASIIRTSGARVIERSCASASAAVSSVTQGRRISTQLRAGFDLAAGA